MITEHDLVRPRRIDTGYQYMALRRARAEKWLAEASPEVRAVHEIVPAIVCQVCGDPASASSLGPHWRCSKHVGRNPCAIEGCVRSRAAPGQPGHLTLGTDQWLCVEHWRRYFPPRSLRRRAYHAFFRKARRHGWTMRLRRQFYRFWDTMIANARGKAGGGTINISEINRLFGWSDDE